MALPLTTTATELLQKTDKTPQIVLQIDGVTTLYGAVDIKKIWRIGDPDIFIGLAGLLIGGQVSVEDQENIISWTGGTSNTINQVLNVDKGTNESVSTLKVALLDKGLVASRLITPGEIVEDILGRRCKIWIGEAESSWKDDYIIIFRGVIDDVDAKSGVVTLNCASPDVLKKSTTFTIGETETTAAMDASQTSIAVTDTSDFLDVFTNISGGIDTSLKLYIKIDDEIMRYESLTGTSFGTLTRAQLGTIAATHDSGAQVNAFYRLEGNAIDLALKFMLSGQDGPYLEQFAIKSFNVITGSLTVPDAVFITDATFVWEYNVQRGDYCTITGATNGANNIVNLQIDDIVDTGFGSYLVFNGAGLVDESMTSAVIDIYSQYDTFGPGAGLGMKPEEVDIDEHLDIQFKFLSSAEYDFYIKEEIEDGKTFLSEQIYNPVSAFAIPRKAQSSIGYHIGPIPGVEIKTLDTSNVLNASDISIKRSINKNFFNTIIYKYEEEALDEKFTRGTVFIEGTSITRIPVGNKALTIESKGMRQLLSAQNTAQIASSRRLKKYKFGAESITVKTNFETGFSMEVGDKTIVDLTSLKITDNKTGTRSGDPRLFEVVNKTLNIKTGQVEFQLVDTNADLSSRYALISPSSFVKTGISNTQFVIDPSFNTTAYGSGEWNKWVNFTGTEVVVRSLDYVTSGTAILKKVTSNTIEVETSLGFTPSAGMIMECSNYADQTATVKLVYASMSDGDNNFADGKVSYKMS